MSSLECNKLLFSLAEIVSGEQILEGIMNPTIRASSRWAAATTRMAHAFAIACVSATVPHSGTAIGAPPQGAIVGWGSQVFGLDLSGGFTAVAAGASHSVGLKSDGSIVAWGNNESGQLNVPAPNNGLIEVAARAGNASGRNRQRHPDNACLHR